jgi:tetratricopeptide (TPR) repeat protein
LESEKIDTKIKHRILNEFLIFTKNNPQFDKDLDHAIGYFSKDKEVKVAKEIGKFFQTKKVWKRAIHYYELHLKSETDDMETILLLMQAYTENSQFDALEAASEEQMQMFPSQPQLYYYNGLANNQLKNYKKAIASLETGIDFIIDDPNLEINFNLQLGEAYNGLGDFKKKDAHFVKANALIEKQKLQLK